MANSKPESTKNSSAAKPTPPPTQPDFDERHGSDDRRPVPQRSGDMDRPGMEPPNESE